jgi:hypothetical protein
MLLAVMALVAEMGSIREIAGPARFCIPILGIVWWQFGSLAAWMTDIAVVLAAVMGMGAVSLRKSRRSDIGLKVFEASIACTVASIGASLALQATGRAEAGSVLGPLAFVLLYLAATGLLKFIMRRKEQGATMGALVTILFVCLAVAGVHLVEQGAAPWVALILGPIFAIRSMVLSRLRMEEANRQTVETLASMLQRAHPYTHRHLGLPSARAKLVHQAALLHDIGKIAVDEDILDLPRKLTDEEFEHVKLHAPYGGDILAEIADMQEMATWIRYHHERPDGRGYPQGLLDPEIPLESKIIAAVDAFDAMTGGMEGRDGRPFREPMSVNEALTELERCSGSQFDPDVVRVFRDVVGGAA